jgi:hypothetical protein
LAYLPRRALRPRGFTPVTFHAGFIFTLARRNGINRLRRSERGVKNSRGYTDRMNRLAIP